MHSYTHKCRHTCAKWAACCCCCFCWSVELWQCCGICCAFGWRWWGRWSCGRCPPTPPPSPPTGGCRSWVYLACSCVFFLSRCPPPPPAPPPSTAFAESFPEPNSPTPPTFCPGPFLFEDTDTAREETGDMRNIHIHTYIHTYQMRAGCRRAEFI